MKTNAIGRAVYRCCLPIHGTVVDPVTKTCAICLWMLKSINLPFFQHKTKAN